MQTNSTCAVRQTISSHMSALSQKKNRSYTFMILQKEKKKVVSLCSFKQNKEKSMFEWKSILFHDAPLFPCNCCRLRFVWPKFSSHNQPTHSLVLLSSIKANTSEKFSFWILIPWKWAQRARLAVEEKKDQIWVEINGER